MRLKKWKRVKDGRRREVANPEILIKEPRAKGEKKDMGALSDGREAKGTAKAKGVQVRRVLEYRGVPKVLGMVGAEAGQKKVVVRYLFCECCREPGCQDSNPVIVSPGELKGNSLTIDHNTCASDTPPSTWL
jgi:hypothetical protein